jgi:hypothetical protein
MTTHVPLSLPGKFELPCTQLDSTQAGGAVMRDEVLRGHDEP